MWGEEFSVLQSSFTETIVTLGCSAIYTRESKIYEKVALKRTLQSSISPLAYVITPFITPVITPGAMRDGC